MASNCGKFVTRRRVRAAGEVHHGEDLDKSLGYRTGALGQCNLKAGQPAQNCTFRSHPRQGSGRGVGWPGAAGLGTILYAGGPLPSALARAFSMLEEHSRWKCPGFPTAPRLRAIFRRAGSKRQGDGKCFLPAIYIL